MALDIPYRGGFRKAWRRGFVPNGNDDCEACGGNGEIYSHSSDCKSDFCALAGGMDDCKGVVEPCPWCNGAFNT